MDSMKILSAAEMQACDRATTERFGIPSIDLMRSAARAVADFVHLQFPHAQRVTILCGRGNNGGDGLMTARLLAQSGREVAVILLGDPDALKGDAAQALSELQPELTSVTTHIVHQAGDLHALDGLLACDLIVDAVLGTGFQPPMRGLALDALAWLRSATSLPPILAIDLPSGWNADSTEATAENAFPADAVITFTAPKPAHVFGALTHSIRQPIVVAPIGSPDEAIVSSLALHWSGSALAITQHERPADSNKGMYGHVLVVGGSPGKSGAPAMSSLAALRTGAGLVTAAVTPSVLPLVAAIAPELMTRALAVTPAGEISPGNLAAENLKALLQGITVLAIGPGLGTTPEAREFALGLLAATRIPAVADADALNILATQIELLPELAQGRTLVLTPHPGEMARLCGKTTAEIQSNRIAIARDFATRNGVILVLKGWRTLIAHPNGNIAVNTTGNPAMAKGGSGDLLTGIVAALLAQHPKDPGRAVEAAVYLHGLAADITVQRPGIGGDQHTLLATDSLHNLHRAFRYHPQAVNGYGWLQGFPPGFADQG
jgi:ADP-dependent NAD(P)H-hydrate dehydratase / NAD(P)H-hydrate epimerase